MSNGTWEFQGFLKESEVEAIKDPGQHKKTQRLRIRYSAIKQECPELYYAVQYLRSRAEDLEDRFSEDSRWAYKWFKLVTVGTIFAVVVFVALASVAAYHWGWEQTKLAGPLIITTIALLSLGVNSFGWHKRFGAMFAARWAMTAVVTRIDQETLLFAARIKADGMTKEIREELRAALGRWTDELSTAFSNFGRQYGQAVEQSPPPKAVAPTT